MLTVKSLLWDADAKEELWFIIYSDLNSFNERFYFIGSVTIVHLFG